MVAAAIIERMLGKSRTPSLPPVCEEPKEVLFCFRQGRNFYLTINGRPKVVRIQHIRNLFETAINQTAYFFKGLSIVQPYYVVTAHGAAGGEKTDVNYFFDYSYFVADTIFQLEKTGQITPGRFLVQHTVPVKKQNGELVLVLQKKLSLLNPEQLKERLLSYTAEQQKKLARELSLIIWQSGFADSHLGNLCLGQDNVFYFIDCKPFGIYSAKTGEINPDMRRHNGRIGVEKLRQTLGFLGSLEIIQAEVELFLKENPLRFQDCPVCQNNLLEV
ncbi:MAG: hypothetical protein WC371_04475 [Parachlamydiales bacterium]|jgi:hypothetical protein